MKVYLDLIFILNFLFDLILLSAVGIVLRRNVNLKRLLLGSFIGALSIFVLFINVNSIELFLFKIIISILMCIATFSYKDINYTIRNLFYLYTASIMLGGFLYLLNVHFSYKQEGLVFYHHGLSINFILLIIISPLIIYAYIKQALRLKNHYSAYYEVDIYFKDGTIKRVSAFLDTGNHLMDPYQKRPIILVNNNIIKKEINTMEMVLVPFNTIDDTGIMKCFKVDKIYILGVGVKKDLLVGLSKEKIEIEGIDCILHTKLLEG